jgi:hypothetical protein
MALIGKRFALYHETPVLAAATDGAATPIVTGRTEHMPERPDEDVMR